MEPCRLIRAIIKDVRALLAARKMMKEVTYGDVILADDPVAYWPLNEPPCE